MQFRSVKLGRGPLGERIEEVTARGKNLLLGFEKGRTLRTHMMMHGSWHIYREGERWRRPGFQARVELHADNGLVAVCFAALDDRAPAALVDRSHRLLVRNRTASPRSTQHVRRRPVLGLRPRRQALLRLRRACPRREAAADHVLLPAVPEVIENH